VHDIACEAAKVLGLTPEAAADAEAAAAAAADAPPDGPRVPDDGPDESG
jgi:hypothetical protein